MHQLLVDNKTEATLDLDPFWKLALALIFLILTLSALTLYK